MATKKPTIIGIALALTGLVALAFLRANQTESVEHAIEEIGTAIEERNGLKFERLVAVDSLTLQATRAYAEQISGVVDEAFEQAGPRNEFTDLLEKSLQESIGSELVEQLHRDFKAALLQGIQDGNLDTVFNPGERGGAEGAAWVGGLAHPRRFAGATDIEQEGDVAVVGLRFKHRLRDTTLILRSRFVRDSTGWTMVRFDNVREYVRAAMEGPNEEE